MKLKLCFIILLLGLALNLLAQNAGTCDYAKVPGQGSQWANGVFCYDDRLLTEGGDLDGVAPNDKIYHVDPTKTDCRTDCTSAGLNPVYYAIPNENCCVCFYGSCDEEYPGVKNDNCIPPSDCQTDPNCDPDD